MFSSKKEKEYIAEIENLKNSNKRLSEENVRLRDEIEDRKKDYNVLEVMLQNNEDDFEELLNEYDDIKAENYNLTKRVERLQKYEDMYKAEEKIANGIFNTVKENSAPFKDAIGDSILSDIRRAFNKEDITDIFKRFM